MMDDSEEDNNNLINELNILNTLLKGAEIENNKQQNIINKQQRIINRLSDVIEGLRKAFNKKK